MVRLFNLDGYEVTVDPEALVLKPFKKIWDRDKTKGKNIAKQELAYIYFMGDPRSDYQYIVDEDSRSKEVIQGLGMPIKWKPDTVVNEALIFYVSFKPISAGLLEDTKYFVNNFRKRLKELSDSLSDLDIKDMKEALAMIKQIPTLSEDLDKAERTLNKDITQDNSARGSQVKAILEDED